MAVQTFFPSDRVELIEKIKFHAQRCVHAKQVAKRMKKLAPESVERIEIEIDAMYHRVQYETHLMMYEARLSLDSYNRARKRKK